MARNGAGTFAVINPIVVGALRSSSAVNTNFTDMGSEITNTVPLNGVAAMSGQFKATDGSAVAPGMSFDLDENLGFRRSDTDEMKWVAGGTDRATMDANGKLTLAGALSVATDLTKTGGVWNPQTLAGTDAARLTMRQTTNDTTEREIASYQSGSGASAKGSLRIVGGGANDIATMRFYVNDVLTFQWTSALFTHSVDTLFGASGIRADTDGFLDFPEVSAPSAPSSNLARLYARDASGTTKLYVKDSAGAETPLQREVDRQTFTSSGTWTKPTTGQTVAKIEMWGGGGSGGLDPDGAAGGGGGAYISKVIALASLSASVSVTVGSGGASRSGSQQAGANGGTSSFGSYLSAFGGGGGGRDDDDSGSDGGGGGGLSGTGQNGGVDKSGGTLGGSPNGLAAPGTKFGDVYWGDDAEPNPFGGAGGGSANLDGHMALFGGGSGGASGTENFGDGGDSVFGGGGGGGSGPTSGGTSIFGGNGGAVGVAGTAPAGGGGGIGSGTSGAGGRGEVRITCW